MTSAPPDRAALARRVRLTGRATRFLSILRDFGHLTEEHIDAILVSLAETHGGASEVIVDLPVVRARVAAELFHQEPEGEDGETMLAEDWPYLFY